MATTSYTTIKNALEQFAENHLSVRRFKTSFFEQIDNFSSSDNTFPILYAIPSDVTFDQYVNRYFFRIYCVDILQKDRSNESAILNDTLLVLRDLYNWLKISDNGLNTLSTSRAIPVNNFLVDFTAGWYIDIEVEGQAESNDCSIPFSSNFILTGYTCDYSYANQFLTCETLEDCQAIIDINNRIDAIVVSADTFVVNGSYDNPTGTLTLVRNDGNTLNITGFTTGSTSGSDIYVTGGTFNSGTETLTLSRNDNQTVVITGFSGGQDIYITGGTYNPTKGSTTLVDNQGNSFEIDGYFTPLNDIYVTGGTFNGTTLNLFGTNGLNFNVTGFTSGVDTFVTGFTYNNANQFTIRRNQGQPDLNVTINTVTGLTTNFFDFNTGATVTPAVGRLRWNDTDGTLDLGLKGGNVTLQIGQEEVIRVVNNTGINLLESNYQAVRINGAQGNRPSVALAQANNDLNSAETIGLVTENINNNQEGFITTNGLVRGINTSGSLQGETWVDGDLLYLSPTVAGRLTKVKPVAPQHTVIVGYVIQANPANGSIFVKVDNGYELDELHNVLVTGATNGQVLTYSASTGLWVPTTLVSGNFTGGTVTGPTIFTGGLSATTFSATTYLGLPTDIRVTGGTYNQPSGTITFTNNTGGTFNVTGITVSGGSGPEVFVTGATKSGSVATFTNTTGGTFTLTGLTDTFVTGGTYTSSASTITFRNNTGGTFNVTGITSSSGGGIPSSVVGVYRMFRGTQGFEVIPSADRLWVASPTDNRVDYFVASTGVYIGGFTVTAAFGVIYVASLNEVWVTSSSSTTIQRYNPTTGASLGSFTGGGNGGLNYVELSPTRLYICNVNGNSVSEINPSTLTVTTTITAAAMGMTSCDDFTYVNNPSSQHHQYLAVVSTAASEFAAINTNTNAVVINGISVSGSILTPYSITYNPFNDRYYITSTSSQFQVNLYNPNTTTTLLLDNFVISRFARQIACDTTTGKVYCTGLLASSIITMPVTLQCFNPSGIEWATTLLSSNADAAAFNSRIKLDTVNGFAYVSGWTTAVTPNIITKIKL